MNRQCWSKLVKNCRKITSLLWSLLQLFACIFIIGFVADCGADMSVIIISHRVAGRASCYSIFREKETAATTHNNDGCPLLAGS